MVRDQYAEFKHFIMHYTTLLLRICNCTTVQHTTFMVQIYVLSIVVGQCYMYE